MVCVQETERGRDGLSLPPRWLKRQNPSPGASRLSRRTLSKLQASLFCRQPSQRHRPDFTLESHKNLLSPSYKNQLGLQPANISIGKRFCSRRSHSPLVLPVAAGTTLGALGHVHFSHHCSALHADASELQTHTL